jgi:DNA-binding CsgD family transcriptional regulator
VPAKSPRREDTKLNLPTREAADPSLRPTYIPVLGSMPWGTHFCLFYETQDDLIEAVIPFMKAGVESKEYCLWVVSKPLTTSQAASALRHASLSRFLTDRTLEIIPAREWLLKGKRFDVRHVLTNFHAKLRNALHLGYEGMRISGGPFWAEPKRWPGLYAFERELDASIAGHPMTVLCTYPVTTMGAADVLDAARTHQCTVARRKGSWEFLETPGLKQAKQEIKRLQGAIDILSGTFPGHELLTSRERGTLAQIVKGASSKEAGRVLGISPRTIEYHRKNIMRKFGAKNTAVLIRKVLGMEIRD